MLSAIVDPRTGRFLGIAFDPELTVTALINDWHIVSTSAREAINYIKMIEGLKQEQEEE